MRTFNRNPVATCTHGLTVIEWTGLGLCLLKDAIKPRPLNGTGFYSEEASIRGKTVLMCIVMQYSQLPRVMDFNTFHLP